MNEFIMLTRFFIICVHIEEKQKEKQEESTHGKYLGQKGCAVEWIVFLQNSYGEGLIPTVMIFGDGAFRR